MADNSDSVSFGASKNTGIMMSKQNAVAVDVSSANKTFDPAVPVIVAFTGGDIKVQTALGDDVTFTNVPDGYELKLMIKTIYNSGTTASDIFAFADRDTI